MTFGDDNAARFGRGRIKSLILYGPLLLLPAPLAVRNFNFGVDGNKKSASGVGVGVGR